MKKTFEGITQETIKKLVDLNNDFYDDAADDANQRLPS